MADTENAEIESGFRLSAVWIIPLLALLLGAFLVVQAWMTEGPEIEIYFETASGLEEGKTKIKYRNVDIGVVEEVRLNDDFKGVIATAKLDRQALPLLRSDTRFWVVTARVGVSSITGLDTLLSGAYIQLAPGEGAPDARTFEALEQPPLTPAGAPGIRLELTSEHAASVTPGDDVIYKGYRVGRVESRTFNPDDRFIRYAIFIDAPYHELVNSAVRFWDVSGFELSAGADGFRVETGSIDTMLLGGVAFEVPDGVRPGKPVEDGTQFQLYDTHDEILENPYRYGTYFVVLFEQSIKGLVPGAPVEYRGIPVGQVERILFSESVADNDEVTSADGGRPIPALLYLEPALLGLPDEKESVQSLREAITEGVDRGLRASLENGNLLTGAKYVGIDYFPTADPAEVGVLRDYAVIPVIDTGLAQIQQKVVTILDKINNMELEETVDGLNTSIDSLDGILAEVQGLLATEGMQDLPAELGDTLVELTELLNALSPGSPTYESIDSSLLRLNRGLTDFENLMETLSEQPNALVLPSSTSDDPEPEAPK